MPEVIGPTRRGDTRTARVMPTAAWIVPTAAVVGPFRRPGPPGGSRRQRAERDDPTLGRLAAPGRGGSLSCRTRPDPLGPSRVVGEVTHGVREVPRRVVNRIGGWAGIGATAHPTMIYPTMIYPIMIRPTVIQSRLRACVTVRVPALSDHHPP
ncbi:hypothetical protein, partial [Frankia sp. CcWB3]